MISNKIDNKYLNNNIK